MSARRVLGEAVQIVLQCMFVAAMLIGLAAFLLTGASPHESS